LPGFGSGKRSSFPLSYEGTQKNLFYLLLSATNWLGRKSSFFYTDEDLVMKIMCLEDGAVN